MHTREEFEDALRQVAADHPGPYEAVVNTEHKKAAHVPYSYEDCIAGCVIQRLEPDIHAKMLAYESDMKEGFSLAQVSESEEFHDLIEELREAFPDGEYQMLADAQRQQDVEHTPFVNIVEDLLANVPVTR